MLNQIASLPELIRTETIPLYDKVRVALTPEEIYSTKQIILTGCGDSYFAGLAAEMAFQTITGLPVQAMSAMHAARFGLIYQPKTFPRNPLVVGVSVSGGVARTVEAVQIARAGGALTLGITATAGSPLANAAEKVLDCTVPDFPYAPGVRSYCVSLLALYSLAIRIAEVTGKITQNQAADWVKRLQDSAAVIERTLAAAMPVAHKLAEQFANLPSVEFIGHGPNYATALFSAAKVVEAAGVNAAGQDTEEWAHWQYFLVQDPRTPTWIISPGDRAHTRAAELIEPMRRVGRTVVAVVPQGDQAIAPLADRVVPIAGQVAEIFNPLVYCIAGELYAAYLAEVNGESYFRTDRESYQRGNNGIRSSRIVTRGDLIVVPQ